MWAPAGPQASPISFVITVRGLVTPETRTTANANGFSEDMLGDTFEKGHDVVKGKGKLHEQSSPMLTKQQFNQLVNLLDHIQVQGGTNTSNTAQEDTSNFNSGAVNFAGPFTEEPSGDW
ncbi:hypothetical protein KY290_021768 [Solanum tuberosum]|uniref:Uncharacterized protein n=1 Tax=Solanum tuberosum TaxID=4113 RepID=A0ABQ7V5K9_SOLTU|nr:hypothetical protein KY289_020931 [Solanum tuberosum]KAH0758275.1 hypothetical protein KY290_021768 [Solanum tuberosum]